MEHPVHTDQRAKLIAVPGIRLQCELKIVSADFILRNLASFLHPAYSLMMEIGGCIIWIALRDGHPANVSVEESLWVWCGGVWHLTAPRSEWDDPMRMHVTNFLGYEQ